MPTLDEDACTAAIATIFQNILLKMPLDIIHSVEAIGGKLYELYCVGMLLEHFATQYGFTATFTGGPLNLKQGGGCAHTSDPHFKIYHHGQLVGNLFTDIQVGTLGAQIGPVTDYSGHHEIDIVLLKPGHAIAPYRPKSDQLLFGIECKATAHFKKQYVREVLGRRRELSYYSSSPPNAFGVQHSKPASAYWVAYIDPAGDNYKESPAKFDVILKHWVP